MPTPTIPNGRLYFTPTLYTGNGGTQSVTNTGFYPDLVWIKDRTQAYNNQLNDSVRGATLGLVSNSSAAEVTQASGLTAFTINGFNISSDANYNTSGDALVAWQWNAGSGTSASNTDGSITSTVSVNTTSKFSVVTYTGNGTSGATVGHGLGVSPGMIIVKDRDNSVGAWLVAQSSLASGYNLALDDTTGSSNGFGRGMISTYSSSTFTLITGSGGTGLFNNVNQNAENYVAYCWAPVPGFSAFGSYVGNASAIGPFVYLGFRPAFVMFKCSSSSSNWTIFDTSRNAYNVIGGRLFPNNANAETAGTVVNFLSNGFQVVTPTDTDYNGSGSTYIYAAFAENPFKYANAR